MSIFDHHVKLELHNCFSKEVYLANKSEEEILAEVEQAVLMNRAISSMLNGDITPYEYLEIAESLGVDNDHYQDEIEDNLEVLNFGDW